MVVAARSVRISALLFTSSPPTSSTHGLPSGPFARLKLSSTAVCGNVLGGALTATATLAVSVPPCPSFTVSTAA